MKKEFDTWLEWAMCIAQKWGLQDDVRDSYIIHINEGFAERASAEMALYDWDLF
tara:strand:+ start:728 stop:889 length:162 start_codon:yes stop_codon:yes gene_type:complete